jgi:hypothetical protein
MICLTMGVLCMTLATFYIPVIVLKARKFAILFSFGSVFFLSRCACSHRRRQYCLVFLSSFQFLDAMGADEPFQTFDQRRPLTIFDYLYSNTTRNNLLFRFGTYVLTLSVPLKNFSSLLCAVSRFKATSSHFSSLCFKSVL